jgi:hypothetical protein
MVLNELHQIGGAVLLKEKKKNLVARSPEEIIAESTAYCRSSGRLMWVVLDWLIRNIQKVEVEAWQIRRFRLSQGICTTGRSTSTPHPTSGTIKQKSAAKNFRQRF